MKALLYCYRSGKINNFLGLLQAGIVPKLLTCPPLSADKFPYERLAGVGLIYIALHGNPKGHVLYGDESIPALSVEGVLEGPDLAAATVILEGCYGAKTAFPRAFLQKGARLVIASQAATMDRRVGLGAAGRAGRDMVRALVSGCDVTALALSYGFEVLV